MPKPKLPSLRKTNHWNPFFFQKKWETTLAPVFKFSYQTLLHLCEQISAIPQVFKTALFHSGTKTIAKKAGYIFINDLLPLAIAYYLAEFIEKTARDERALGIFGEHREAAIFLQKTVLLSKEALFQVVRWHLELKFMIHLVSLTFEASNALNLQQGTLQTPCIKEKCSELRFLKGAFRDLIQYLIIKFTIHKVNDISTIGPLLATFLNVYHNGRYIITVLSPNICNIHQEQYLREYPELALSHGIGHYLSTTLFVSAIENYLHLPTAYFAVFLQPLMLLWQISVAAQLPLPKPVKESKRFYDPLSLYHRAIGFGFDTICFGMKKQIPRLLEGPVTFNIPWKTIYKNICDIYKHSYTKPFKKALLPKLLHSKEQFTQDPVIPWSELSDKATDFLQQVLSFQKKFIVQCAMKHPKLTARLTHLYSGTPAPLIVLFLELLKNPQFVYLLKASLEILDNSRPQVQIHNSQLFHQQPTLDYFTPELIDLSSPQKEKIDTRGLQQASLFNHSSDLIEKWSLNNKIQQKRTNSS